MIDWVSTDKDATNYFDSTQNAFPKLNIDFRPTMKHLAIHREGRVCGGITLEPFENIQSDFEISTLWNIEHQTPATRMRWLWLDPQESRRQVLALLRQTIDRVSPDQALYGVLSFPFEFALSHSEYTKENLKWVTSKHPVEKASFFKSSDSSSDGKMIFRTYKFLGAKPLGEMSASPIDSSVKLLLGVESRESVSGELFHAYA